MAKVSRLAGSTSHILQIFVQDSSKTDGSGLAGLTAASSGLTAYYTRNTGTGATAITLTGTGTLGTYASGFFKEIDATNMPGVYQFHPPDAAYASGAKSVVFMLRGATNMAPVLIEVELTAVDNQSAAAFLTGVNGLAPPTNWNVMAIDASGRVDVGKILGTASAGTAGFVGIDWSQVANKNAAVALPSTSISTAQAVASVSGNVGGSVVGDVQGKVLGGGSSSITGDGVKASAVTGAVGSVTGAVGSVAGSIGGDVAGKVLGGGASTITGDGVKASAVTGAVGSVTGAVGSVTANVVVGGYASGQDPATLVLDASASSHNTSGTIGNKVNSAAAAGDPLSTSVPGSYVAGTVGYLIGTNLDARVSTRSAPGTAQTIDQSAAVAGIGDLSAVTAPTLGQALAAAFMEYACPETLPGTQASTATWVKKTPGGATGRSFSVSLDGSGNAIGRS